MMSFAIDLPHREKSELALFYLTKVQIFSLA